MIWESDSTGAPWRLFDRRRKNPKGTRAFVTTSMTGDNCNSLASGAKAVRTERKHQEDASLESLAAKLRNCPEEGYKEFRRTFFFTVVARLTNRGVPLYEAEDLAESCVSDVALHA